MGKLAGFVLIVELNMDLLPMTFIQVGAVKNVFLFHARNELWRIGNDQDCEFG